MAQSAAAVIFSRGLDIAVAALLILFTLPLLLCICCWLLIADRGPVFYRQHRLGLNSRPFILIKFRTLKPDAPEDSVTPEGDEVITPPGKLLRRYRFDELPQLLNVIKGDMAMVGPRPEIALDLQELDPILRSQFLSIKPGITGWVQLEFIAEDALLAEFPDPTRIYRERLIPIKVLENIRLYQSRSIWQDFCCLLNTVRVLFSRRSREQSGRRLSDLLDSEQDTEPPS